MTAPTPRGVREAHQELYGNASVSLEFAAHDLAPENAPFNLAKVRGFIREARESVNLACNALMRAMTAPTAAEREGAASPLTAEQIVNGVCTRCKGDAYLFYDAAGGHCWKCDVSELTAALRTEKEQSDDLVSIIDAWCKKGEEYEAALLAARREVDVMRAALTAIRDYKPMPIEGDRFSFAQTQRLARAALAATPEEK